MAFNAMFNAIFEQIAQTIVTELKPANTSVADVKSLCDCILARSLIEISFGSGESKIVHKPVADYKVCSFVLARGKKSGEICGKKAKSGCEYCTVHESVVEKSKIPKDTCEHVLTKGKNPGKVCGATAMKGKNVCSKHSTAKKSTKKEVVPKAKPVTSSDEELEEEVEDISDAEDEMEDDINEVEDAEEDLEEDDE